MPDTSVATRVTRTGSTHWFDENSRGLALAADGEWSSAADAFTAAVDVVSMQSDVESHEAQALVLSNLAQACFKSGRTDDAIRHAQRACALRVALLGEDAIAVARARVDLAVMLGSANKAHEGLGLMKRAIAGIERSVGDEDLQLATVLECAARLAMSTGQPSEAEPYLLRLHALLDVHEMPLDSVEVLLARLTAFRVEQQVAAMESMTSHAAFDSASEIAASLDTFESASVVELPSTVNLMPDFVLVEEYDDQPLRDAVELTDVLLRSTPTSVRAFPVAVEERKAEAIAATRDILDDSTFDMIETEDAMMSASRSLSLGIDVELDLVAEIPRAVELDLVPAAEAMPNEPVVEVGGLGFTVEYGAVSTELSDDDHFEAVMPLPVVQNFNELLPSPSSSQPAIDAPLAANDDTQSADPAPRVTRNDTEEAPRNRQPRKPVIRAGDASTSRRSTGMIIAGSAAAAAVVGAAWFMFLGH